MPQTRAIIVSKERGERTRDKGRQAFVYSKRETNNNKIRDATQFTQIFRHWLGCICTKIIRKNREYENAKKRRPNE